MSLPTKWPYQAKSGNSIIKIYRSQRANNYVEFKAVWRDSDNKRRFKTFADFEEAKMHATNVHGAITEGGVVTLGGADRHVYNRAIDVLKPLGVALDRAAEDYVGARAILGNIPLLEAVRDYAKRHPENLKKTTVQEIYADLLKAKKADGVSDVHLKDLKVRLGRFSEAFHCNVNDLTVELINEFLRSLDVKGRSRNNYRRTIGSFIRFAEIKRAIPKGQVALAEIAKVKAERSRKETFTAGEMVKLLNAAQLSPEDLKPGFNKRYAADQGLLPLLVMGAFAGMRTHGEIRRQKWTDINLETGFIRVTDAKPGTAADRLIPIHNNLRQWLAVCRRTSEFCCTYARPEDALRRLAERAGLKWKRNALRHSYGTYRTAQTNNLPQVALEMGNSPQMIFKNYREVVTPAVAEQWFKIVPTAPAKLLQFEAA